MPWVVINIFSVFFKSCLKISFDISSILSGEVDELISDKSYWYTLLFLFSFLVSLCPKAIVSKPPSFDLCLKFLKLPSKSLLFSTVFRYGDYSLFDTKIGLILLYCVFNLPFAIWLLKGIIDGIPKELDEAMVVDGANLFTIFYKLIIPLAAPGIAVTSLLSFLFAWNEYLLASTLSSVYARTIPTGLSEFVTTTGTNWGMMAAVAVVSMIPALLFLMLVQKYIVAGLTFGAVKG